jgi:flavin reductase (DIM6/NTAB) family NADH-FMN oxidoreductase RutF
MSGLMTKMDVDRRAVQIRHSATPALDCVQKQEFASSMRVLGSGVVVVTSFVEGKPWGLTLSSLSAFSADPARVSLSITKTNVTAMYIREHESFGVAILPDSKSDLASGLAAPGKPKFIPDGHLQSAPGPVFGLPAIDGALFNLECRVVFHVEAVDHILIVADVVSARAGTQGDVPSPLIYFNREFGAFIPTRPEGGDS